MGSLCIMYACNENHTSGGDYAALHLRRHKVNHIERFRSQEPHACPHVFVGEKCRSQTVEGATCFSALIPRDRLHGVVCHHSSLSHIIRRSGMHACISSLLTLRKDKVKSRWREVPSPPPDSQFYIGKKKNTDVIDGQSCIYLDTVFNDVSGAMAPNMLFCTTLKYLLLHLWVRHDDLRSPDSGRSIQKERHSVVELTHLPELRLE
jgi:hypothetical protein